MVGRWTSGGAHDAAVVGVVCVLRGVEGADVVFLPQLCSGQRAGWNSWHAIVAGGSDKSFLDDTPRRNIVR